jgi:hypothetical protein
MQILSAWRAAKARHQFLRYVQIIPVALVLWATDAVDRFRPGAATAGLHNALTADTISRQLGGGSAAQWSAWLAGHPLPATAASWYYIVLNGAVTGVVGILLIWKRVPSFPFHRNALIACNLIALIVFWLYPVAPPRMLAGYHDVTASAVPVFSSMFESKAADQFASLPSLHVTWALWVAVAAAPLLRGHPVLRAAVWLYPAATILDVLATANHFLLDIILAPGVLMIAYLLAAVPGWIRGWRTRRRAHDAVAGRPPARQPVAAPGHALTGAHESRDLAGPAPDLTGAERELAAAGCRPATAIAAGDAPGRDS